MSHSIEKIKSTLKGGGARPNLFQVNLTSFPGGADYDSDEFSILCKAAQLPASNIASIDVPFRGRIFKVAGDRTFDTWTVTVINDNDFKIRTAMEAWMQFVGQYADGSGATDPGAYQRSADVIQFARNASALSKVDTEGLAAAKQYRFYGIFPTNISAIDLSYDTGDTIEEFTVEFQVQYWAPADLGAGETNAGTA
jgi:hypothetical protein|tara:strand:- start:130 stop:717 length:588 start_codon:yes stop_codon:yes gene_type:complete